MAYQLQNPFLRNNWTNALMAQELDDFMAWRNRGMSGCPMNYRNNGIAQLFDTLIASQQADAKRNNVVMKKDALEVNVDCEGYEPSELTVKVADGYVTVSGKHESKSEDGSSHVTRQFKRKHSLPNNVNISAIDSKLSDDKVLRIKAPLLAIEAPKDTSIPIAVTHDQCAEDKA